MNYLFVDATQVKAIDYQKILTDFNDLPGPYEPVVYVVGGPCKLFYKLKAVGYHVKSFKTPEVAYAKMAVDILAAATTSRTYGHPANLVIVSTSPAMMPILEGLAALPKDSFGLRFVSYKISPRLEGIFELVDLAAYKRVVVGHGQFSRDGKVLASVEIVDNGNIDVGYYEHFAVGLDQSSTTEPPYLSSGVSVDAYGAIPL